LTVEQQFILTHDLGFSCSQRPHYCLARWLERNEISEAIHASYQFPDCFGIVDDTLFPLEFKPQA